MTSASTSEVARHLVAWAQGFAWPACATTIDLPHLQQLYPDLEAPRCQDMTYLLQRVHDDAAQWEAEIIETLAKQFGIQSWRKQEVQDALERFAAALQHASQFDMRLRQHVLTSIASIFADAYGPPATDIRPAIREVLAHWYTEHPIPAENDLSDDASILLRHITAETGDAETVLLSTLPRALADIGQAYQQWPTCQVLDHYLASVQQVVGEINAYVPLTGAEHAWLTSIVTQGLRRPLTETAWEQRRLLAIVAQHLHDWLSSHRLPRFAATLSEHDMRELFPKFQEPIIATGSVLVHCLSCLPDELASMLLTTLPAALGQHAASSEWGQNDVDDLLERFMLVCQLVRTLGNRLEHHLYTSIGKAFGVADDGDTIATILAGIHNWPKQHILLPGEKLSPNATALHSALQTSEADPRSALLVRLPREICEVGESYEKWQTWNIRTTYVTRICEAACEIAQRGRVGDATPQVQTLWEQFKAQLNELTPDERRWLIKAFNEEFQP
ncbi:MAG: hypothetical protein HC884_03885 [Chloroflexaceae bacterium]|nr:hypothetical protein [Chloroflexaceae bacterium]